MGKRWVAVEGTGEQDNAKKGWKKDWMGPRRIKVEWAAGTRPRRHASYDTPLFAPSQGERERDGRRGGAMKGLGSDRTEGWVRWKCLAGLATFGGEDETLRGNKRDWGKLSILGVDWNLFRTFHAVGPAGRLEVGGTAEERDAGPWLGIRQEKWDNIRGFDAVEWKRDLNA
jgi:hypothetical protein